MILNYEFGLHTYAIVEMVEDWAQNIITDYGWLSVNTLHDLIEDTIHQCGSFCNNEYILEELVCGRGPLRYADEKRGWREGEFHMEVIKDVLCSNCGRSKLKIKVSDPTLF